MFVIKWSDKNKARIELLSIIQDVIKANNWTQRQAGSVLKLHQPKISLIKHFKTNIFSIEKIFMLLCMLDYEIEFNVSIGSISTTKEADEAHIKYLIS